MFRGHALNDVLIKLSETLVVDKTPSIFALIEKKLCFCASRLKKGFEQQLLNFKNLFKKKNLVKRMPEDHNIPIFT